MGSREFRLQLGVRVALLVGALGAFVWVVLQGEHLASIAVAGAIAGILVVELVRYVETSNREIARFLVSLEHNDATPAFGFAAMGTTFRELAGALRAVLDKVREARLEREEQARYLQVVLEHVPVALISVGQSGDIGVFNTAARRLFGIAAPRSVADLARFGPDFFDAVSAGVPGRPALVKAPVAGANRVLRVVATEIAIRGQHQRLVSVQNIENELDARELAAWQDLIRVLTHEMMNSLTPVASLAALQSERMAELRSTITPGTPGAEIAEDIAEAADAIARRAQGLHHFVQGYRQLTRSPQPTIQRFAVAPCFRRIERLMSEDLESRGIALALKVEPDSLELEADPELLDQAVINLLRNAADAVKGRAGGRITVSARRDDRDRTIVEVADNGPGIPADQLEKIFVPFYTTKRHGSGIGLSVVRQIMLAHGGSAVAANVPGGGASFMLRFG